MRLTGWGGGRWVGCEARVEVRWARESRRWASDLEVRRERWWVNWEVVEGAVRVRDCWERVIAVNVSILSRTNRG